MIKTSSSDSAFLSETSVNDAFEAGCQQWQACDWAIQFGPLKLNLQGLRCDQAKRLARATSGRESAEWLAAADWLQSIEAVAAQAEEFARNARDSFVAGCYDEAAEFIDKACELEAAWPRTATWENLRQVILGERGNE